MVFLFGQSQYPLPVIQKVHSNCPIARNQNLVAMSITRLGNLARISRPAIQSQGFTPIDSSQDRRVGASKKDLFPDLRKVLSFRARVNSMSISPVFVALLS